jgi:hypothetical protein
MLPMESTNHTFAAWGAELIKSAEITAIKVTLFLLLFIITPSVLIFSG